MANTFMRIDGAVNRIGYWYAGYGIVTAAFTWLSKRMTKFGQIGWPEAVVAGFLLASLAGIVLALGLMSWRYFRPLSARADAVSPAVPEFTGSQIVALIDERLALAGVNGDDRADDKDKLEAADTRALAAVRLLGLDRRRHYLVERKLSLKRLLDAYIEGFIYWQKYYLDNDLAKNQPPSEVEVYHSRISGLCQELYGIVPDWSHPNYSADPFTAVTGNCYLITDERKKMAWRKLSEQNHRFVESVSAVVNKAGIEIEQINKLDDDIARSLSRYEHVYSLSQSLPDIVSKTLR